MTDEQDGFTQSLAFVAVELVIQQQICVITPLFIELIPNFCHITPGIQGVIQHF
ncbi:hypothetical protein N836_14970 [Leptolyngbya sp. Heron Island J]|nr:hypothetical protein N836_14970 [Leptolyngbya sp. Heron Island J]